MAGHVELGYDAYAAIPRVLDDAANLFLRVVLPVRAQLMQPWESTALDAKALIVGEMPVKYIELHRGHGVQVALDDLGRHPVSDGIDEQSAPREARSIEDSQDRQPVALGRGEDELR